MGISIDTKRAWRVRTLGDLTVIVNPAAELKKWSDIQRAVRKHNGYDGVKAHDRQDDTLFRRNQRPTYIALTSTWNWAPEEVCKKGKELEEMQQRLQECGQFLRQADGPPTSGGFAMPEPGAVQ